MDLFKPMKNHNVEDGPEIEIFRSTKEDFVNAIVSVALELGFTYTDVYLAVESLRDIFVKNRQEAINAVIGTEL